MRRILICTITFWATTCLGQHNNRSARDLEFSFGNPGARSLAFGGAFTGLADDATAPVVNPAGMAVTQTRSLSLEVRYHRSEYSIPFYSGSITQTNLFEFDFDLESRSLISDRISVPYAALVIPHGQMRFAVFAHELADLQRAYETEPIEFNLLSPTTTEFAYDASADVLDMRIEHAGLSWAWDMTSWCKLGVSAYFSRLDYISDSTVFLRNAVGDIHPVYKRAHGDDSDWGTTLGLLMPFNELMSIGITYHRRSEFEYQASLESTQPSDNVPENFTKQATFKIPDAIALGMSIRPSERLTLNVDAERIYYSQITDELVDFTGYENVSQAMPDITEIRTGAEWAFPNLAHPLFLRIGYRYEPYHAAVNNREDNYLLEGTFENPIIQDVFFLKRFAQNAHHYSGGFGLTLNAKLQLDLGFETSQKGDILSCSGIYRF